jgi:hypothetical protein
MKQRQWHHEAVQQIKHWSTATKKMVQQQWSSTGETADTVGSTCQTLAVDDNLCVTDQDMHFTGFQHNKGTIEALELMTKLKIDAYRTASGTQGKLRGALTSQEIAKYV